ncbi:MAG TPA: hypothetical protein VMU58_06370 [Gaiellaceae bacterium]|nr:hypothetical protein [Gaiellaceae bacterium]
MQVAEISRGLWRWTGWRETIGAEVGCVYHEGVDGVVLIDPLVPPEDDARFWEALDFDVARAGRQGVHVLTTVARHARSTQEIVARYDGRLWSAGILPNGIAAFDSGVAGEVVFWLPDHRTLVSGDVLVGRDGGLAVTGDPVRRALDELAALPVERILVSHGEPVLERGGDALRAALSPRPAP